MSNELLFLIVTVVNFAMVLLFFRFFRHWGIFAWIAMATVIANIEVLKCCNIFGMAVTLGNVVYGSLFLCTDILSELYGKRYARRALFIGFFALGAYTIMMQLALLFEPNDQDFVADAMHTLFSLSPRICFTSIGCFLLSNYLDVWLYDWLSKRNLPRVLSGRKVPIWLKNNSATMISQFVDTVCFTFIAFWGLFPLVTLWELIFTTMVLKVLIALLDTPFLYGARAIARRYHGNPKGLKTAPVAAENVKDMQPLNTAAH